MKVKMNGGMSLKISSLLFHAEGVFKIFTCSKNDKLLRGIQDTMNTTKDNERYVVDNLLKSL